MTRPKPLVAAAFVVLVGALAAQPLSAFAADRAPAVDPSAQPALHMRAVEALAAAAPSVARPHRIALHGAQAVDPVWTPEGLWAVAPRHFRGLAAAPEAGPACWDPSSQNFFAVVAGVLVRVDPGGALIRRAAGLRGTDFDIRAASDLVVVREEGERIVAIRPGFSAAPRPMARRTLWQGDAFFGPRLSPDGRRVLVEESRAAGGHVHAIDLSAAQPVSRDLGAAFGPAWWPDGRHIVASEVAHDGERITGADLVLIDALDGSRQLLARTAGAAEVEPTVSLDGRWLAWRDARTDDLCIAVMPAAGR